MQLTDRREVFEVSGKNGDIVERQAGLFEQSQCFIDGRLKNPVGIGLIVDEVANQGMPERSELGMLQASEPVTR